MKRLARHPNAHASSFPSLFPPKDMTKVETARPEAGSTCYMAPECYHQSDFTEKVDIFALGVSAWQTGRTQGYWVMYK